MDADALRGVDDDKANARLPTFGALAEDCTADRRESRRLEIERLTRHFGPRAPQPFIDHYIETGVLDGRLWPIVVPIVGWPGNE